MVFLLKFSLDLVWYLILSQFQNHQALYGHLLSYRPFLRINFEFSNLDAVFLSYADNKSLRQSESAIKGFAFM